MLDEFTESMFSAMGIEKPSPNLISIYREFKRVKDKVQPGRLSAEGLATVVVLAEMADMTLELPGSEVKPEEEAKSDKKE